MKAPPSLANNFHLFGEEKGKKKKDREKKNREKAVCFSTMTSRVNRYCRYAGITDQPRDLRDP